MKNPHSCLFFWAIAPMYLEPLWRGSCTKVSVNSILQTWAIQPESWHIKTYFIWFFSDNTFLTLHWMRVYLKQLVNCQTAIYERKYVKHSLEKTRHLKIGLADWTTNRINGWIIGRIGRSSPSVHCPPFRTFTTEVRCSKKQTPVSIQGMFVCV